MNLKNFQVTQRDSNPWPLRWALHRHRRGYGLESRWETWKFFRFMRQLLKIVQQVRGSYLHLKWPIASLFQVMNFRSYRNEVPNSLHLLVSRTKKITRSKIGFTYCVLVHFGSNLYWFCLIFNRLAFKCSWQKVNKANLCCRFHWARSFRGEMIHVALLFVQLLFLLLKIIRYNVWSQVNDVDNHEQVMVGRLTLPIDQPLFAALGIS